MHQEKKEEKQSGNRFRCFHKKNKYHSHLQATCEYSSKASVKAADMWQKTLWTLWGHEPPWVWAPAAAGHHIQSTGGASTI